MTQDPIRTLVVGSSGRVGILLRQHWFLEPNGALDLTYQTRRSEGTGKDISWDPTRDPADNLSRQEQFDCMLVLSGVVPRPGADFEQNQAIAKACLTAAATADIPNVLLASTSAVYGAGQQEPFTEDGPMAPLNDYGRTKLDMEQQSLPLAKALGVGLCCLRIGNVAGADALMCNGFALGDTEKLRLDQFEDGGTPVRSYIGPATLADVLQTLIRKRQDLPESLNIGAPAPLTMRDLAEAARFNYTLRPAPKSAHQNITLNCGLLETLHHFDQNDSKAGTMAAQVRRLKATE